MRKEIEVKLKIPNMKQATERLVAFGCVLSGPVRQNDVIFVGPDYGQFDALQLGKNIARIRESDGRFLFTIKQPQTNELDSREHETEILDPGEMREALLMMGYSEAVRVSKLRRKGRYGEYELCLDEVDGLGPFLEVEKITEAEDPEVVQKELLLFVDQLGIEHGERVESGYDTLVYRKNRDASLRS